MASKQGFTLIEIVVVLLILGIFAAAAIPNFISFIEQTKAQVARNNLLAISAAEQKYNEDHGNYCLVGCGDSVTNINTNLHLGISDKFSYSCVANLAESIPYNCTASDTTDTLTLDPNLQSSVSCTVSPSPAYCPS